MEPIAVCVRGDGEWALVHRCVHRRGPCTLNPIAGDHSPLALRRLAVRPLAQPTFPLDGCEA